jgi:beta-glucosidase
MLMFVYKKRRKSGEYDRDRQHAIARKIAEDGIVLLKNDNKVLPITSEKYKKVAVVGEYATHPLIAGQGSAEVLCSDDYIDSPLEELRRALPDVSFDYIEMYRSDSYSHEMLWPKSAEFKRRIESADLVLFFAGSMVSEDTENFDRLTAYINQNVEMFIGNAMDAGKPVAVVLSGGGALIFGDRLARADAIIETFLAGEAMGGAAADVLSGKVNPSGKLPETFPVSMRRDLEYPGNERFIEYKERFDVGYRYYDKHPEEIRYPFGHGLSYTDFTYSDVAFDEENMILSFNLSNTGDTYGAEAWQIYVSDPYATVVRPVKELRHFGKEYLAPGETKRVEVKIRERDLSYYNTSMKSWCVENGRYDILVGSSSRDIRLSVSFLMNKKMPYTLGNVTEAMIG